MRKAVTEENIEPHHISAEHENPHHNNNSTSATAVTMCLKPVAPAIDHKEGLQGSRAQMHPDVFSFHLSFCTFYCRVNVSFMVHSKLRE